MPSQTDARTGAAGLGAIAVGLIAVSRLPLRRLRAGSLAGELAEGATFVAVLGLCLVVWGVSTARSNEWRSLTPRRALAIPLLAVAVVLATELLATSRVTELWTRPFPTRIIVWQISAWLPMGSLGASTAPVVGSALRQRDPRWLAGGIALALVVTALATTPDTAGMPMFVLAFGVVPGLFGYAATAPPTKDDEASSSDDVDRTVPHRTAIGVVLGLASCLFALILYVSLTLNKSM